MAVVDFDVLQFGLVPSKFHLISVFNVLFSQDELILYTRMQLKLQYVVTLDEGGALEELMGLVEKELDQIGISLTGRHRLRTGGMGVGPEVGSC